MLDDSILVDVRQACDIDASESAFDGQLIPLINSQIMMAHQLGVGYDGFMIRGTDETWGDLLGEHGEILAAVRTWMGYSVKMLFDPPENGTVNKAMQDQIAKMEWMLCSKAFTSGQVKEYVTPEEAAVYDE